MFLSHVLGFNPPSLEKNGMSVDDSDEADGILIDFTVVSCHLNSRDFVSYVGCEADKFAGRATH
jgi:hypothetical protein